VSEKKNNTNLAVRTTIILIVDDHPIVRDGLAELLNHEADLVVSARAGRRRLNKKQTSCLQPGVEPWAKYKLNCKHNKEEVI
jgi:hypothetical protein